MVVALRQQQRQLGVRASPGVGVAWADRTYDVTPAFWKAKAEGSEEASVPGNNCPNTHTLPQPPWNQRQRDATCHFVLAMISEVSGYSQHPATWFAPESQPAPVPLGGAKAHNHSTWQGPFPAPVTSPHPHPNPQSQTPEFKRAARPGGSGLGGEGLNLGPTKGPGKGMRQPAPALAQDGFIRLTNSFLSALAVKVNGPRADPRDRELPFIR